MTDVNVWDKDEIPTSDDVLFWAIQMYGDLSFMSPEETAA